MNCGVGGWGGRPGREEHAAGGRHSMSVHWAPGTTQDFAFLVVLGKKMPGTVCARSGGRVSPKSLPSHLFHHPRPPPHTHICADRSNL